MVFLLEAMLAVPSELIPAIRHVQLRRSALARREAGVDRVGELLQERDVAADYYGASPLHGTRPVPIALSAKRLRVAPFDRTTLEVLRLDPAAGCRYGMIGGHAERPLIRLDFDQLEGPTR